MTNIVITNETIKTNEKIYVIKHIKNVKYNEEEINLIPIFGPMVLAMLITVYFLQNIYTIGLLILFIILCIPKKNIYKIYINNDLLNSYVTYNKNEFNELKRKIQEALDSNKEPNKIFFEEPIMKNKFQENLKKQEERYKQRYKENIQDEKPILKKEPMSYVEKKQKGDDYEAKVAGYYKLDGYDVYLNGIKNGFKDGGIDIICKKDDTVILIQCKNWDENHKYKIDHNKIKAFHSNCIRYIDENNLIKENTKLIYAVPSKKVFKENAIEIFRDEYYNCRYEILKF